MNYRLIHADVIEGLRQLGDGSAQCVVTSPPYWGLRDYGTPGQIGLEPTPEAYVARLVAVFREVRRVLKDDGTLWLNLGDTYSSGGRVTFRDAASGKQDYLNGTAVRAATPPNCKPKDLVGIPWMVAFALRADGWYLRSEIIWHKPNPMPESVTDRPTKAHEQIFLLTKNARYFYDAEAIAEDVVRGDAGSTFTEGNTGVNGMGRVSQAPRRPSAPRGSFNGKTEAMAEEGRNAFRAVTTTRNKRSVWTVATAPFPEAHFATFPPDLIEPCILAGSRVGDTVLDPFNGAGTSGVVALSHQRHYVGIELNGEYVEMSRRRLANVAPMFATEIGAESARLGLPFAPGTEQETIP